MAELSLAIALRPLRRVAGIALLASAVACTAAPIAPTPAADLAGAPAARALFDTTASGRLGALILSGSATTVPFGSNTTIRVSLSAQVAALRWDFGDGTTSTLFRTPLDHYYPAQGRYHAVLVAVAFDGSTDSADGYIDVLAPEPDHVPPPRPRPTPNIPSYYTIAVTGGGVTIPDGGTVTLSATATGVNNPAPIAGWAWSCFGDGAFSAFGGATSRACTFASAGIYRPVVVVVATDRPSEGAGGGSSDTITVLVPVFTANCPGGVSAGAALACTVTATLAGVPIAVARTNWHWGDTSGDDLNVVGGADVHTYGAAGTYHVTLRAAVTGSPTLHTIAGDVVIN